MSAPKISKADAAQRQLDTAIDLFFDEGDSLSAYTLAFASFKVLLNVYPHQRDDDFASQVDRLINESVGWRPFSEIANFLKHADRDPEGVLENFDSETVMPVIGLATLLYRRITGSFSRKMEAFDFWIETTAADKLGIEDADENEERRRMESDWRHHIRQLPANERMKVARSMYHYFLDNRDGVQNIVENFESEGKTLTQALDEHLVQ